MATFNRDFTRDELLGKLSCIMYDSSDGEFLLITKASQPEDETIVRMSTSTVGPELDLQIEGNNLVVSDEFSDGWIFDIDFNGQHKKVFEKTSAVYLMQLPNIIATSSTPKYAIAQVTNNLDASAALTVNLAINDTNDYQPIAADTELTDIDVNDWFNNESGSANFDRVARLVKLILQMEYNIPSGVTFNVSSTTSAEWTVDGGLWNLFTDGSAYIPLVLTSRMPNGNPVRFANGQQAQIIATFNRAPQVYELIGKVESVVIGTGNMPDFCTMDISDNDLIFSGEDGNVFGAEIQGQNLLVNGTEDAGVLYDVDYDKQHQRTLTIPHSGEPLMFEIHGPNILEGPDKLDVFIYSDDFNYVSALAMPGTNNVAASRGSVPPQEVQMDRQQAESLIEAICRIEFANYENFYFESSDYGSETISGTVDLLTVSTVTPA